MKKHPQTNSVAKPSFTVVEILIAATIFVSIATIGVVMSSHISKSNQKTEMEEYLYAETQALLERLSRTIENSTIDYEEYYNQEIDNAQTYGSNYGKYHQEFFDPDTDFETGKNPYEGSLKGPEFNNALCAGSDEPDEETGQMKKCSTEFQYHQIDELYLINGEGNLRTYFISEDNAIKMLQLEGQDDDRDGIAEEWACAEEFECSQNPAENLPAVRSNFISISPQNLSIEKFELFLSPIEDPYKGYNEIESATEYNLFESVQIQPKVTLMLTTRYRIIDAAGNELPFESTSDYIGQAPEITVQTTIGSGVYHQIKSYSF